MEPPNKGHFGTNHSVHCREDVLFSEVSKCIITMGTGTYEVSIIRGPFLRGSFIGGFTVFSAQINTLPIVHFTPVIAKCLQAKALIEVIIFCSEMPFFFPGWMASMLYLAAS